MRRDTQFPLSLLPTFLITSGCLFLLSEIGLGLTAFGIIFTFLGMLMLFDRGLIAMGNVRFASPCACMYASSSMHSRDFRLSFCQWIHAHKHTHAYAHRNKHKHARARTRANTHAHKHTHSHIHMHMHTHAHVNTRAHTHANIHPCTHLHTRSHLRPHANAHMYTHAHVNTRTYIHARAHVRPHAHLKCVACPLTVLAVTIFGGTFYHHRLSINISFLYQEKE